MDVLTNKNFKQYTKLSRYAATPYYYHTLDKKYIYGTDKYLKNNTLYTSYIIKEGDTLDSIALDFYNNPTLYWIICSYNRIQDPFIQLKEGDIIKIPSISNIEFES